MRIHKIDTEAGTAIIELVDVSICRKCWLDWLRQEVTDEHYHSWG